MSAPVGPTGCRATNPADERRPFTIGLSYGSSDTRLIFSNKERYRFRQSAYSLSFLATLDNDLVLGAAVGPHMGGRVEGRADAWVIRPGVVWSFVVARRWFGTKAQIPYLLVVGTFSGSSASTRRESDGARAGLHALDFKGDLSVGWTLGEAWSPYLAVRGFGGPVFWHPDETRRVGSDLYHVSVAAGFNLTIANRVSVYFDGAFVGMRGLSGGASVRF
ncbi:hypothetical protein ENSA5_15870 [Enhygromyxa salina]|uniref:Cellulose biosynthesis protein BcsS n=1 Tax=Enhygromyxa salina TaxID=215803 RepID=A0A2S9YEJ3_9BACT|nr:hypothetical protein [Enhygromyxa salina]PRQ03426.1 hypothetical protein ENSA5_15870 [Enhygromyxa salina]